MFTVIMQSKRCSDLMRDYKFLFKPFLDEGLIAFCDWNESGTDVQSSVPDLYNLVKGKNDWRAIIINTDSVYDYKGVFAPDKTNPFDYSSVDQNELPHESPVPIVRLTHIIGGYSTFCKKDFEKAFEYIDEASGEKVRVPESRLTQEEIHSLSENYYETLNAVYIEKEDDPTTLKLQESLCDKYAFSDIRPSEILLISTRKKPGDNERAKIIESWKNHLEMTSSAFWEKNRYPNNCRFLFYDITNSDNSLYHKELTEFWLSVLTVAINRITASTLQAYRLYKLHIDVSKQELTKSLNLHLNKMNSVYTFIREQLLLRPVYTFDEEEEVVGRQVIPVTIEKSEGKELFMNFGGVGLCRDCPDDDSTFWSSQLRAKKDNLKRYLKAPRRVIDKAAAKLKVKTESFTGEYYELDKFQLADLKEYLDELEDKVMTAGVENVIDKKKVNDEITAIDKKVRREITYRLDKKTAIIGGLCILLIVLCGYIPYLLQSYKISEKYFFAAIGLTAGVLGLSALGGIVALLIQRKKIVRIMKKFNDLMRSVSNNIRSYALRFENYFSDICTYMKGRSILDGINMRKENAMSNYSLLNAHKQALQRSIERDVEWVRSYGIDRVDEIVPTVTAFFNSNIVPKENSLYYFEANYEELDIPINSTGDTVTAPYKFVEKLWIEREEIFDEEEGNA
ncbi:MAG: hypothetical protein IJA55_00840 [Clostridia bacterium]|nr:hypothetical protein [Clostridia bacterium]